MRRSNVFRADTVFDSLMASIMASGLIPILAITLMSSTFSGAGASAADADPPDVEPSGRLHSFRSAVPCTRRDVAGSSAVRAASLRARRGRLCARSARPSSASTDRLSTSRYVTVGHHRMWGARICRCSHKREHNAPLSADNATGGVPPRLHYMARSRRQCRAPLPPAPPHVTALAAPRGGS